MAGLFGGFADPLDWLALVTLPIAFYFGARAVVVAPMEFQDWRPWDRVALFIGRATMIMIVSMTSVMLTRYSCATPSRHPPSGPMN